MKASLGQEFRREDRAIRMTSWKKKHQNFEEFYPLLLNTEQTLNEVHSNNDWEQGLDSVYWNRHVCVFPCLIYSPSLPLFLWVTVVIKKHWKLILMSRSHVMIDHKIWSPFCSPDLKDAFIAPPTSNTSHLYACNVFVCDTQIPVGLM